MRQWNNPNVELKINLFLPSKSPWTKGFNFR